MPEFSGGFIPSAPQGGPAHLLSRQESQCTLPRLAPPSHPQPATQHSAPTKLTHQCTRTPFDAALPPPPSHPPTLPARPLTGSASPPSRPTVGAHSSAAECVPGRLSTLPTSTKTNPETPKNREKSPCTMGAHSSADGGFLGSLFTLPTSLEKQKTKKKQKKKRENISAHRGRALLCAGVRVGQALHGVKVEPLVQRVELAAGRLDDLRGRGSGRVRTQHAVSIYTVSRGA